jgi:hypothetical protein
MTPRFRAALEQMAREHKCRPSDILSSQRRYKHLRWELWWRFYQPGNGPYSLTRLAKMTGFDHTSVRYGILRYLGYTRPDLAKDLVDFIAVFTASRQFLEAAE